MVSAQGNPDTLDMIRKRVDPHAVRVERYAMEEMWLANFAYYSGHPWFYIENGRIWDATPDLPEHKVIYKANLIRSACLRAAAKIVNVRPRFRAVPQSASIMHRNVAETSERVFDHIRDKNDWDQTLLTNTLWAMICGSAFYKVWFDPLKGDKQRFYTQGGRPVPTPLIDPQTQRAMDAAGQFEDVTLGDVRIDVCSPFSIYHDWTSRDKSVEGCQWIGERHFLDRQLIAERYGIDEQDLQPEETSGGLLQYEEAVAFLNSNMGFPPLTWATPLDKRGERCMYVEMWERPSRRYKKGRRVVYAGQRIIRDEENPYIGDKTGLAHLPYVKQDWTKHPGRFWGSSLVEDMRSPQHHLNDARACKLEFLRIFGRPITYIDANSGLDPDKMSLDPGGIYKISAMSRPPIHSPTPQLGPNITEIAQECQSDLLAIASQSEIDGSKMPGQMRSGAALRTLQEDRDVALSVSSAEAIRATRDVGRMALSLGQMFYGQKRTLRYLGEDNQVEYRDYVAADLTNDLIVIGDPSIADSVTAKRAEVLDAIQVGALNPQMVPEDRELVLAALHYNDSSVAVNVKLQARRNQEFEIRAMVQDPGKYPNGYPVMDFEDHQTELSVCQQYMYSQEFKTLDPFTQSIIAQHAKMHQMELQKQQLAQLQMMEAAKGMPGQQGKASQPTPSA